MDRYLYQVQAPTFMARLVVTEDGYIVRAAPLLAHWAHKGQRTLDELRYWCQRQGYVLFRVGPL